MAYNKTTWENAPSTNTPINANNLNKMEEGIYENSLTSESNSNKIGALSNLQTTNKSNLVAAVNEVITDLDNKQDAFIIETVTLGTSISFTGNDTRTYGIPDKTGYTGYVLKPYISGDWSDKYAVYVPWNAANRFGIRNVSSTTYSWSVYCVALYIKDTE